MPDSDARRGSVVADVVVPLCAYTALTVWLTWPLSGAAADRIVRAEPALFSEVMRADLLLIVWILRWTPHALLHHPARLFDGNMLHPASGTLAASENLFGDVPLFGLVEALGGTPVLALNVLTLTSFPAAALAMHVLVLRWSGSRAGAWTAGLAFGFAPWRFPDGLSRAHLLQVAYLPLILLALDTAARRARIRAGLAAAALLVLQTLASFHLGYLGYLLAVAYVAADVVGRGVRRRARALAAMAVALVTPLSVIGPLSAPYLARAARGELVVDEVVTRYLPLTTPAAVLGAAGWGPSLLAIASLAAVASRRRDDRVRMVALALAGVGASALALAHQLPVFHLLAAVVPGLANFRAPVRFAIATSAAAAALSGYAVAAAGRGRPWRRAALVLGAAGAVLVPLAATPRIALWQVPVGSRVSPAYAWLAEHGAGRPLLELPLRGALHEALAVYHSTYHWLPLVNGYTSYPPSSYRFLRSHARQMPTVPALQRLVDCAGIGWMLVHESGPRTEAFAALPGLREQGRFRTADGTTDRLFAVVLPAQPGCSERLFQTATTVDGHPIVPLARLDGRLTLDVPAPVPARTEHRVSVTVANDGRAWWPATGVRSAGRVGLVLAWQRPDGGPPAAETEVLLPRDVGPRQSLAVPVWMRTPLRAGPWVLVARLAQAPVLDGAGAPPPLRATAAVVVGTTPPVARAARAAARDASRDVPGP